MGNSHQHNKKHEIDIEQPQQVQAQTQQRQKRRATVGNTNNMQTTDNQQQQHVVTPKKRKSWTGFSRSSNYNKGINILSPNPMANIAVNDQEKQVKQVGKIKISTFHSTESQHSSSKSNHRQQSHVQYQNGQQYLSPNPPQRRKSMNSSVNAKLFSPTSPNNTGSRLTVSTASPQHGQQQGQRHQFVSNPVSCSNSNEKIGMTDKEKIASRRRTLDINEIVVASRFHLISKLGKGSFGVAYKSLDLLTNKHIAIKLERKRDTDSKNNKQRRKTCVNTREISILERLNGCHRVPQLIWHGNYKQYHVMALELQGMNLSDLYEKNGKKFSLQTVIYLLVECILCIEAIHAKGIVHRDIKPQNFIISCNPLSNKLYIIDYGLSSWFINSVNEHIAFNDKCSPVGTARYASIHNHRGVHQTRRDDLESIGYMICFFMKGSLPWQGLREAGRVRKWRKIEQKKSSVSNATLTQGLPMEFCYYLDHVKKLKYGQKPNYKKLVNVMKKLYVKQGFAKNMTEADKANPNFYKTLDIAEDVIPDWRSEMITRTDNI